MGVRLVLNETWGGNKRKKGRKKKRGGGPRRRGTGNVARTKHGSNYSPGYGTDGGGGR